MQKKKSAGDSPKKIDSKDKKPSFQGIQTKVTQEEIDQYDFSKKRTTTEISKEAIEKAKAEFLGEDDIEDNKDFIDSDVEFDLDNEEEKASGQASGGGGLFKKLTSRIQNFTGGKQMSKEELAPVMKEFADGLIEKNVAQEIAIKLCESVE